MGGAGNMSLPQPKVALTDACSVIFNNTLYTYSADAFQSLPLTRGASWSELKQGERVTGGVCVGSTPADSSTAAFFVVGGRGESADYQGLQKFTYSTGKWEAVVAAGAATKDRTGHGATYINSTDTILVYAGALDNSTGLSTTTFSITASSGDVLAHPSVAPPAYKPILLPWSDSHAALVGGSTSNLKVTLFSVAEGWTDSGTTLASPLQDGTTALQAVLVKGDDGSKNLYTFNASVSPNVVERIIVMNDLGGAIADSKAIVKRAIAGEGRLWEARRREAQSLTLGSWPSYNSTNAPTSTKNSFSLAEDGNGLVTVAGGDDVLSLFNARENGWEDAAAGLGGAKTLATDTGSSTTSSVASSSSTPTSTAATSSETSAAGPATATPTMTPGKDDKSGTKVLLGSGLGSILGVAALLMVAYFLIKRRHRKRAHLEAGHSRRASGPSAGEKDGGYGFAKDSLPRPLASPTFFRGHQHQESASSFSSMAMLMGRFNQPKPTSPSAPSRNPGDPAKRTSADSMFSRAFKNTISKPMPHQAVAAAAASPASRDGPPPRYEESAGAAVFDEKGGPSVSHAEIKLAPAPAPRPRNNGDRGLDKQDGSARRSSGWNRYWSGGSTLSILGFGGDKQQQQQQQQVSGASAGNGAAARDVARGPQTAAADPKQRSTLVSVSSSHYSDLPGQPPPQQQQQQQQRMTQESGNVLSPLHVYEPRASFSRVNSASPTIAHLPAAPQHAGMSGQIETSRASALSMVSALSDGAMSASSAYVSGVPTEAAHQSWVGGGAAGFTMPWAAGGGGDGQAGGRVPSSAYSQSVYTTALGPAASRPVTQLPVTSATGMFAQQEQQQRPPTGVSRQPPLARAETSDMSWLNLGDGTR